MSISYCASSHQHCLGAWSLVLSQSLHHPLPSTSTKVAGTTYTPAPSSSAAQQAAIRFARLFQSALHPVNDSVTSRCVFKINACVQTQSLSAAAVPQLINLLTLAQSRGTFYLILHLPLHWLHSYLRHSSLPKPSTRKIRKFATSSPRIALHDAIGQQSCVGSMTGLVR